MRKSAERTKGGPQMDTQDIMRKYGDIISLPHHVSNTHPHMPVADRAAQFAPFAALTGYGEVIKETARRTDAEPELTEDEKERLNDKLILACTQTDGKHKTEITYFVPDRKKAGGAYHKTAGKIRRVDADAGMIFMETGEKIRAEHIVDIRQI